MFSLSKRKQIDFHRGGMMTMLKKGKTLCWQRFMPLAALMLLIAGILSVAEAVPPDPRDTGPFATDVVVIDEGCVYDLDGVSLTWTDPPFGFTSPVNIFFGDDDFSGTDPKCSSTPTLVDMEVRVHFPGTGGVVAAGGPFPLVVFLHGQQIASIPGYEGYDYLGELLASHGFIVASIDGRSLLNATIKSRGEHVREHLRRFVARNATGSGSFLEGEMDLSRVTVVGHSRGGESVVAAYEWQRVDPDPGYTVIGVVAIAPVQFIGAYSFEPPILIHLRDAAYQIIHGAKDCDVCDFQGYRQYDRAADIRAVGETLKSLVFVKDANHNFFNTVWESLEGSDCGSSPVLSGNKARDLAKVYIHSFLQVVVKGNDEFRGYLTGEVANPVSNTTVALDFQAPGSEFITVDDFEELPGDPHDKLVNTLGGKVRSKNMTYQEQRFAQSETSPRNTYKGETYGAYLLWSVKTSKFIEKAPKGGPIDPGSLDNLSFRVGQIFRSSGSPNPPGANQDFFVRLKDASGNRSPKVKVSDFAPIHPPFPSLYSSTSCGTKTVMNVVRIPLDAFTGIDLTAIKKIQFRFKPISTGEIVMDDLRFSK
jgi:hypothetical protein